MTVEFHISAAPEDENWSRLLAGVLAELGAPPPLQLRGGPPALPDGPPPVVLLVLTSAYFAEPRGTSTWAVLDEWAARGALRLLPVLVERISLPKPLRDYPYVDVTDAPPAAAADVLRQSLAPLVETYPIILPAGPPRFGPERIAIVVAPDDEGTGLRLTTALLAVPRVEAVGLWRAYRPTVGDGWGASITVSLIGGPVDSPHPDDADLVLVGMSRALLGHGYLESAEFRRVQQRQNAGQSVVVPVLLAPVSWDALPAGGAPTLPRGTPLSHWSSRDDGVRSIVDGVRLMLAEPRRAHSRSPHDPSDGWPSAFEAERGVDPPPVIAGQYTLDDVFKRSGTPTLTFVEPPEYDRFVAALRTPGRGIVLEGPSGIGKTTLLQRAAETLDRKRRPRLLSGRRRSDLAEIARLPNGHRGTVVVDDVHRLPVDVRTDLVDYLKLLADEESAGKLVLVGIPGTGNSLVEVAHDVATRIDVFRLPPVSDVTIEAMVRKGEQALNVAFAHRSGIVLAAAGSLLTAQMLCWELAAAYRIDATRAERTPITADIGLALSEVMKTCELKFGPALRRFAALDGPGGTACVALLAALRGDNSVSGPGGVVSVTRSDPALWPGFAALAEKCPDGLADVDADVAAHLHYDPHPGYLAVEDPQLLFYLRRLSVDRLYETVGKRRPRVRDQVFVSYSHRDAGWLERLERHLRPLVREGTIDLWSDRRLTAGDRWHTEIATALDRARVAILLVSSDFLASDFITGTELPPLLRAAASGGCRIIPVIVNPCMYAHLPELTAFQSVNSASRPLTALSEHEQDEVFVRVALTLTQA